MRNLSCSSKRDNPEKDPGTPSTNGWSYKKKHKIQNQVSSCYREKWIWIPKLHVQKVKAKKISTNLLHVHCEPIVAEEGILFGCSSPSSEPNNDFLNFQNRPLRLLNNFASTIIPYTLTIQGAGTNSISPLTVSAVFVGFNRIFEVFLRAPAGGITVNLGSTGSYQITATPSVSLSIDTIETFIPVLNSQLVNKSTPPPNISLSATFSNPPGTILIAVTYNPPEDIPFSGQISFTFSYFKEN